MYIVRLINFGYNLDGTFPTMEAALAAAKRAGFEAAIWRAERLVASWSILGGTRYHEGR
jgi:hypothetical protein